MAHTFTKYLIFVNPLNIQLILTLVIICGIRKILFGESRLFNLPPVYPHLKFELSIYRCGLIELTIQIPDVNHPMHYLCATPKK